MNPGAIIKTNIPKECIRGVNMARNKYPEVTINRILDAALQLFLEKGYEKTTIKDVVDSLQDLSKGAIYHHFKSKDDLLQAVTERMYRETNLFNVLHNDENMCGFDKIRAILIKSIKNEEQRALYKSSPSLMKNPQFLSRQLELTVTVFAPQLREIIELGIEDKSIETDSPKELSEVMMVLFNIWLNPSVFYVEEQEFYNKIIFLKSLFNGLGFPIIDDEIQELLMNFNNSLK